MSRLARAKAETARDQIANDKDLCEAFVLAADTIVAVGRRILVKPRLVEEAVASLQLLSGRNHRVLTGICLITPDDRVRMKIVDTRVRFKRLSKDEIESYIASRECAERPAAMRSRASPAASSRSFRAHTPTWWACR